MDKRNNDNFTDLQFQVSLDCADPENTDTPPHGKDWFPAGGGREISKTRKLKKNYES